MRKNGKTLYICEECGFVINYIKKPFKSEELISTIDSFFEGKEEKMVLETFEKHIDKREQFKQEGKG